MDNFQIETAQNVSIQQRAAGVGERILGYLLDSLILVAYWLIAFFTLAYFGIETNDNGMIWVFFTVLGIPAFLYYLLFETFWDGRTPGKAALNLRVVKLDGSKPGFGSYFVRWLMRIVDISITSGGVAVFTILFNGKGQRLGDIAASTTVINEKKKVKLSHTLLEELPEDYQAKYPEVTIFSDKDMGTIKGVYEEAKRENNHKIIVRLSDKIAATMGVNPEERPYPFIDRVIKDYNYYTQQ